MAKPGRPLEAIPSFPRECVRKLAAFNITTAEGFVSVTNTPENRKRIADVLALSEDPLWELVTLARNCLPEDLRREMEEPCDTSMRGLGALDPKGARTGPDSAQE